MVCCTGFSSTLFFVNRTSSTEAGRGGGLYIRPCRRVRNRPEEGIPQPVFKGVLRQKRVGLGKSGDPATIPE